MKTTEKTTIKIKMNSGFYIDVCHPKGTDIKEVIIDLISWAVDDKLEEFQQQINEEIEHIKANN